MPKISDSNLKELSTGSMGEIEIAKNLLKHKKFPFGHVFTHFLF